MASFYPNHTRPLSETAVRTRSLLARYPDISERELDELIQTFPKLPILDVGLMTADEEISSKVAELYRTHGKRLATSNTSLFVLLTAFLVVPAVTIAVFWFL